MREHLQRNSRLRILPIGILRDGRPLIDPDETTEILENDRLVYVADNRKNLEEACARIVEERRPTSGEG